MSVNVLTWLKCKFPLAIRKRTNDSEDFTAVYKPQIYLKSKEWFNLEPDTGIAAYSFFYTDGPKTDISSDGLQWTQTLNLVVFANLNLVNKTEDSIFTENLIQNIQDALTKSYLYSETILGINNIYEGIDDTWTDFSLTDNDKFRFMKGNTTTFRFEMDVRYVSEECLC